MQESRETAMSCRAWLVGAIETAELALSPYAHLQIDQALPPSIFEALVQSIPPPERMSRNADWKVMANYANRYYQELERVPGITSNAGVWRLVQTALDHPDIPNVLAAKFANVLSDPIRARVERGLAVRLALQIDDTGSWLGPHTDSPSLFAPGVLYLKCSSTADGSADTHLCVPTDSEARLRKLGPDYSRETYAHEDPADHIRATRVRFAPNRLFVFLRSFVSLHALGPLSAEAAPRATLLIHTRFADTPVRSQQSTQNVDLQIAD
jgi:hypothetical protein